METTEITFGPLEINNDFYEIQIEDPQNTFLITIQNLSQIKK